MVKSIDIMHIIPPAHSLQHLDLSYNNLGPVGVELLLTCVNHTALGTLTLASVIKTYSANNVTKHVYKYLTQVTRATPNMCTSTSLR